MLAPALATMLCVVTTDAVATAEQLDIALRAATHLSFDRLDVDGATSTNDTVLLLASGASGVTPTQGWWDAELVKRDVEDEGVLVYEFRLQPPAEQTGVSTQQSREIDVAIYLSDVKLQNVREIVVQGAKNARSARR